MRRPAKTLRRLAIATMAASSLLATQAAVAHAADSPAGFYYGADSDSPTPGSSPLPYREPGCTPAADFASYVGEIGSGLLFSSQDPDGYTPGFGIGWNATDASEANVDHFTYGIGEGAGAYFWLLGPDWQGDDLSGGNFGSSVVGTPAYKWGEQQGQAADADWQRWYDDGANRMPFRVIWADVENGDGDGYPDWAHNGDPNGWFTDSTTNAKDDQANFAVWAGFRDKVNAINDGHVPGMYSSQSQWDTFVVPQVGTYNTISGYNIWTAENDSGVTLECPSGWSQSVEGGGTSPALYFAGQSSASPNATMWQWSTNGSGDWDQVDANRLPADY